MLESRSITNEEVSLIKFLLANLSKKLSDTVIPKLVFPMNDGGMGSIRFTDKDNSHIYLKDLINADYYDCDGVLVSISLNVNTANQLFELDIFKGDFSSLMKFPQPKDLINIK